MTLALIKPAGWDEEDPLLSDEVNEFQERLVRALDGQDGGTYELQEDLIFEGPAVLVIGFEMLIQADAVLDVDGTVELGGTTNATGVINLLSGADLDVETGGEINVKSGGQLDVESGGEINLLSGGQLDVRSGASIEVESGGDINVASGGAVNVAAGGAIDVSGDVNMQSGGDVNLLSGSRIVGSAGAEIQVNDMDDLTINADSYVFWCALEPCHVGAQWASEESGTFRCATVATANRIVFPLKVPAGDTITTLRMTIDGGVGAGHGGGAATDRPVLELCRVNLDGTVTTIQTVADPVNTGSYDDPHTVTMSGGALPYLVTTDRHIVRVIGEGITGGVANTTRLCSIDGTALARSVRQTTEVR